MSNVKTSVCLRRALFEQADALAREMRISRSSLFALALEGFLRDHETEMLIRSVNEAYSDAPDAAEKDIQEQMRRHQRRMLEGQW